MTWNSSKIATFLEEGQHPKLVERMITHAQDLLFAEEEIHYLVHQDKPLLNVWPKALVLTDRRIMLFKPVQLGLSHEVEIFPLDQIAKVQYKEGIWHASLHFLLKDQRAFQLKTLPKTQGRKAHQWTQTSMQALQDRLAQPSHSAGAIGQPLTDRLHLLKDWFASGLINEEEYNIKKKEILDQL